MAERRSYPFLTFFVALLVLMMGGGNVVFAQESGLGSGVVNDSTGSVQSGMAGDGANTTPAPPPEFDLQKFLALDNGTVKLSGLEPVYVWDTAAVYADSSGQMTAQQLANRYLRQDRPTYASVMGASPRGAVGPVWVVLSIYNQTGPSNWVMNFGDRLSGRLGKLKSLSLEDIVLQKTLFSEQVSVEKGVSSQSVGVLKDSSIYFNLPEGHATLLIMKLVPDESSPFVFPIKLMATGVGSSTFLDRYFDEILWFLSAFGVGAALFAAMSTRRYTLVYIGAFVASFPFWLVIPGALFGSALFPYQNIVFLLFGAQFVLLALSGWAIVRSLNAMFKDLIVQVGIGIVGAIIMVLAISVLASVPTMGLGLLLLFGSGVSFILGFSVVKQKPVTGMIFLSVVIIFMVSSIVQVLGGNTYSDLGAVQINAISFSSIVMIPLFLTILSTLPFYDHDVRDVGAPKNRDHDKDKEKYNQLLLAKESFDYNNLLKVIEHERKQLSAARTREMVRADEMRKAKDQADEANRAKSAFLAVVSHEIRTPMTGVMGMVKLLEDTTLTKSQNEYTQAIRESGNAMMSLLNDILDFEKIESGRMQLEQVDFDLHRLLDGIMILMGGHASSKGIALKLDIDFSVPAVVMGDMVRLRQVLLNLVGNAVKFTYEGSVTIRVSSTFDPDSDDQGHIVHHIYFAIEDTGVGISPAGQKNIFIPFAQGDKSIARKFGGSGLGLAISRRLVEAMGSSINVKSKEGEGTIFFFTINMVEGDRKSVVDVGGNTGFSAGSLRSARTAPSSIDGRSLRILILEDNNITQRVLQTLIEKENHKVTIAPSAEDAIGFLEMGERFDLIFADINLSGISGLEFTRIVRKMPDEFVQHVPIVAISGNVDQEDIESCRQAGMTAHVAKPIDPDLFLSLIRDVANNRGIGTQLDDDSESNTDSGSSFDSGSGSDIQEVADVKSAEDFEDIPLSADEPVPDLDDARSSLDHETDDVFKIPSEPPYVDPVKPLGAGHDTLRVYATLELDLMGTLRESLGVDQLNQLLDGLYTKTEEIIGSLESQKTIDPEFTMARAHEMKGMCGNFGFQKLSEQARTVEKSIKSGELDRAQALIKNLRPVYDESRLDVEHWIQT